MNSGRHLGSLVCLLLVVFSFIPGVMGAGEGWSPFLSVYGTIVSTVTATVHKNFTLNGAPLGSEYLTASAPANMSRRVSTNTTLTRGSNESQTNLNFAWNINPALFPTGYYEVEFASFPPPTPSGITYPLLDSFSFTRGAPGTSWGSNLTVLNSALLTKVQAIVNYTWTDRGTQLGTAVLSAAANETNRVSTVTENTTLPSPPTAASVNLTLRLYYKSFPWKISFSIAEGNANPPYPENLLAQLDERGGLATPASISPSILLLLSLSAITCVPVIRRYRRRG